MRKKSNQRTIRNVSRPRARALEVPFDGVTGPLNAITDVAGVEVGHATIIRGHGKLIVGRGPVRTGVTAILPRGKRNLEPVFAGYFALNGNGEMTGTAWIEESGFLTTPIMITNTHSVGTVRDAVIGWLVKRRQMPQPWSLPVVAETWDGRLNDTNGFHVKVRHAWAALDSARSGRVTEGCVGGGTGMIGYGWKGGIGTASRRLERKAGGYTLGVLVQLNCGRAKELTIAGVPIGRILMSGPPPVPKKRVKPEKPEEELGSIIVVAATDAPLLPHQLKRIARRLTMGLARTGSVSGNGSGDLFIAFSTASVDGSSDDVATVSMLSNARMDPLFTAAVQATEEAIVNAMVAATTMIGINGERVEALPHDRLIELMNRHAHR